jgi:outer membrane receptor protein involved in Fe transport
MNLTLLFLRKFLYRKLAISVVFCLISSVTLGQVNGRLSGTLVNRSNQQPMGGLTISIQPGNVKLISDSTGYFRFNNLKPGSYNLNISGISIQSKDLNNIIVTSGNENTLTIELEPAIQTIGSVTVSARKSSAKAATLESPLSIQRLTTEDIKANPGGNFDISKVIQSLPGVGGGVGGGGFRNDIIIRGGAPSENVFYLDGIEVPIINHFSTQGSGGGPQGILNVSFIEDVKLSTSAFDARYDNALSSVFQFKQKNGNAKQWQGNFRLSGTEAAITMDGPLSPRTTMIASARRSYLGLLFTALDLPIRPNYWDFQFKSQTKINAKTTLTILGIGAIDEFRFEAPDSATPEKIYTINSNPLINQTSYTFGATLKRLMKNGYWNLSLSRNLLNNSAEKFEDNQNPNPQNQTFNLNSTEAENKLRFDFTQNHTGWTLSGGLTAQWIQFDNKLFQIIRPVSFDSSGNPTVTPIRFQSKTDLGFLRYGGFLQAGTRLFDDRLAVSGGIRLDGNTLSNSESNPLKQFSPRVSVSYALSNHWNASASWGRYFRLPGYPQMAFAGLNGVQNPGDYIQSTHTVAGLEYLPRNTTRFTLEGFYKKYSQYPVSINNGISLANVGTEFGAIGNEPIVQNGEGLAYGFEFFAQQKLTKRLFGVFSYTLYWSNFTGLNGVKAPASWDNRHLISFTGGYKFNRNWELGLKFRYQGAAPFTPYDETASRLNFLTLGTGTFDYSRINSLRLRAFHSADIRIDKKWNFKKTTLDLFLDIQNLYGSTNPGIENYTFKRNENNTGFATTDGQPIKSDGSNAVPVLLNDDSGTILPTIGFIIEF